MTDNKLEAYAASVPPTDSDLYVKLTEPISPDDIRPVTEYRSEEEIYETHRSLLRANRPWRRALRLHWWHLRYLLVRAWARISRPWEDARRHQRLHAYTEYFAARAAYEEAKAAREQIQREQARKDTE